MFHHPRPALPPVEMAGIPHCPGAGGTSSFTHVLRLYHSNASCVTSDMGTCMVSRKAGEGGGTEPGALKTANVSNYLPLVAAPGV